MLKSTSLALLTSLAFAASAQAAGNVALPLSSVALGEAVVSHSIPQDRRRGALSPQTTLRGSPLGGDPGQPVALPRSASAYVVSPNSARRLSAADVTNLAVGTSSLQWPYTTSRVASASANATGDVQDNPVSSTPFRQTGILITLINGYYYSCTASLILPNVIVTAAHCVQDYGMADAGWVSAAAWIPANTADPFDPSVTTPGPFGVWEAAYGVVPTSYFYGTDTCSKTAPGIVCNNDLAVLSLVPLGGQKAGSVLEGTYSYGTNGYSFVKSKAFKNTTVADVTQLGYPAAFDAGVQMQRNNSFAQLIGTKGRATTNRKAFVGIQLGSAMTQGASGGPVLVNFGTRPNIDSGASLGNQSFSNVVVGVTSYGYLDVGVNVQGATFFGQNAEYPLADYGGYGPGNIGSLLQTLCGWDPDACVY